MPGHEERGGGTGGQLTLFEQFFERTRVESVGAGGDLSGHGESSSLAVSHLRVSGNLDPVSIMVPYMMADYRMSVSVKMPVLTVDGISMKPPDRAHRLLVFLSHPDRINKPQKYSHILEAVPEQNPGTSRTKTRVETLNKNVAALRSLIRLGVEENEDPLDLIHPKTGFIRIHPIGYLVVSTLAIPPVRPY